MKKKEKHTRRSQAVASAAVCASLIAGLFLFTGAGGTPSQKHSVRVATAAMASQKDVDLSDAMQQRVELLKRSVTIHLVSEGKTIAEWPLGLEKNPSWVVFDIDAFGEASAAVNAERIRQYLISYPVVGVTQPKSCSVLTEWVDEQKVLRAQTDCIAESGYLYDITELSLTAKTALEQGNAEAEYSLTSVPATISASAVSGSTVTQTLKLLSTGQSNFEGSGAGRKSNVRKALNERVNNIIVPQGAVFSFNSTLGTVALSKGWKMALTIFEGANLRPAPGGGICQASTTTYRAALSAGLPILVHKNHSLYVTYYEKYGVGQDATIFPGQQDLTFVNDTPGPLLIQSYNRGDDAFVHIYGIDDGRKVVISGPYFTGNAPKDLGASKVRANDIAWKRDVTMPGAAVVSEVFLARYKAIPRSLSKRTPATVTQVRGLPDTAEVATIADAHAAAR